MVATPVSVADSYCPLAIRDQPDGDFLLGAQELSNS